MDDKADKSADSANDEWIVDGDLYLIKTISRYPILWDRKNFDSELRNEVWLKLSKKLKIRLEWMKKRWSYLREQYVRHLKQLNNLESDKPSKRNYKYFNEMSFLASHIQIRNGNFQEVVSHIAYKPANVKTYSRTEPYHRMEYERDNSLGNVNVDFVITENEIEAYNDDDDDLADDLFVELSDEEKEEQEHPKDSCNSDVDLKNFSTLITQTPAPELDNKPTPDARTKPVKPEPKVFEDINLLELRSSVQNSSADTIADTKTSQTESRCEDVIFGELVTSMLKKMDTPDRKRAKKEILNILLS